jgi:MobA/MobL family
MVWETVNSTNIWRLNANTMTKNESRQPSTLARSGREPRLLPRPGERRPGPGVAVAPSRLLAQASTCRHCVTRCLNGATHLSRCRNSQCGAVTVTRGLIDAELHQLLVLLLSEADRAEDRANGRFATELELALPHELDAAQRRKLAETFARQLADQYGVAVDVALHIPGFGRDHRNHHAHVLVRAPAAW